MRYGVVLFCVFLLILLITTRFRYDREISSLNETIERLEERVDDLSDIALSLQRELHSEGFDYPFNLQNGTSSR